MSIGAGTDALLRRDECKDCPQSEPIDELRFSYAAFIEALARCFESGIPVADVLGTIGIDGRTATLVRAYVSRMAPSELAAAARASLIRGSDNA